MSKKDELFQLLEKHLDKYSKNPILEKDLIHNVVAEYIYILMMEGFIPSHFLDQIEQDITTELQVILKKKRYGFAKLSEYINSRKKRQKH